MLKFRTRRSSRNRNDRARRSRNKWNGLYYCIGGGGGREEDDKYLANYRTGTVPLACLQPHPTPLPRPPCSLLALFVTVCGVGRAGGSGGGGRGGGLTLGQYSRLFSEAAEVL